MGRVNPTPILVTGAHRSGTTWVGRMLALSDQVSYIHEPFNPGWRTAGISGAKFMHYFSYVNDSNEDLFIRGMKKTLRFRYNWLKGVKEEKYPKLWKRIAVATRDLLYYTDSRLKNKRPLLKDPIALFSAEWLASRFDMRVIVMIRHPAAFVQSIKAKNWRQPFKGLLKQEELMEECLSLFREEITHYAEIKHPIIDEASIMWKIMYAQVLDYMQHHEDWLFIRHEDLSLDPVGEYEKIFEYVGVPFTERIVQIIKIQSGLVADGRVVSRDVFRDSRANITTWKSELNQVEIELIRKNAGSVSDAFYSDKDW